MNYLLLTLLFLPVFASAQIPKNMNPKIDWRKQIDWQGHRGARGLLPENSLPAFQKALELGVQTLEMDVVISQDGEVVVSHEPWMNADICTKPDGDPVSVAEAMTLNLYKMPYAEIKTFDCGLRGNPRFPVQQPLNTYKPLLRDVIRLAKSYISQNRPVVYSNGIYFNIEIKSLPIGDGIFHPEPLAFAQKVYDVLRDGDVLKHATVQSFDPRALRAMRTIDPKVSMAFLVETEDSFEAQMAKLDFIPAVYSPKHTLVTPDLVQVVHHQGMKIVPWTVNDLARIRVLIALGVDGIITDFPNLIDDV